MPSARIPDGPRIKKSSIDKKRFGQMLGIEDLREAAKKKVHPLVARPLRPYPPPPRA